MKRVALILFFSILAFAGSAMAQEFDATVDLNLSALNEQDRVTFEQFKHDLEGYINNYSWTTNFSGERIRAAFQFNIMTGNGSDYTAQLFVSSTRPLYKSDQVTTMARFFDDNVAFTYIRGQEFQHGNSFRSLESIIDFYAYIILGLDYDSYKQQSGTMYFQQAQQVAVIANAAQGPGWERKVTSVGTYSRLAYIEDALNANNRAFRDLWFTYHFNGLDLLSTRVDDARVGIGTVIDSLVTLRRESSAASRSVYLRNFFESKYPELTDLSRLFPDNITAYFQKLEFLDPVHQNYYEDARTRAGQ